MQQSSESRMQGFTQAVSDWLSEIGHAVAHTELKTRTENLYFVLDKDRRLGFSGRVWSNYHPLLVIQFLQRQDLGAWLDAFPVVMVKHPRGRGEMMLVGSSCRIPGRSAATVLPTAHLRRPRPLPIGGEAGRTQHAERQNTDPSQPHTNLLLRLFTWPYRTRRVARHTSMNPTPSRSSRYPPK